MKIESTCVNHKLVFDEGLHRYWLNGQGIPGVTTVNKNGYPMNEALLRWKIKQGIGEHETNKIARQAADIGTLIHDYAYQLEIGNREKVEALLEVIATHKDQAKLRSAVNAVDQWWSANKDVLIAAEAIVASTKHRYGGKFDRLSRRGKLVVLSDFKTSSGIFTEHFIQLGLYAIAVNEWLGVKVNAFEILRFGKKDAAFETKLISSKEIIKAFEQQGIRNVETYYFRKTYDA